MTDQTYFTTDEAAAYLRRSRQTLTNWRHAGTGPKFFKPTAGMILYVKSDLDAFVRGETMEGDK